MIAEYTAKLLKVFQDGSNDFSASTLLKVLASAVDVKSIQDQDGMSLLHLACHWDWSRWGVVIKLLIEKHQCDSNAVNEDGDTPLHVASQFNNAGAVHYLLSFESCDPNLENKLGLSPLDIAHNKQHRGVLRELLSTNRVLADPYVMPEEPTSITSENIDSGTLSKHNQYLSKGCTD